MILSHLADFSVGRHSSLVDRLVVEVFEGGADVVLLSHLKVLSEVLVSAPPVGPHGDASLVLGHLMEVRVPQVDFVPVHRELFAVSGEPLAVLHHASSDHEMLPEGVLTRLAVVESEEACVELSHEQHPDHTNTVLVDEALQFPVAVSEGVLKEPGDVLERSPLLSIISRLLCLLNPFCDVAVGGLQQGSVDHLSPLVDVGDAVLKGLDSCYLLPKH